MCRPTDVGISRSDFNIQKREKNGRGCLYKDKRTGIYIVRLTVNGKPKNYSTHTKDPVEAEKFRQDLILPNLASDKKKQLQIVKAQLEGEEKEIVEQQINNADFPIEDITSKYFSHPESKDLKKSSQETIRYFVKPFIDWCKNNNIKTIHQVSFDVADNFLIWLADNKSANVYNNCVSELNKIYRTIKRTYYLKDNPFENRKSLKHEKKIVRSLSDEEMKRLKKYLDTQDIQTQVFWAFGYMCGMSVVDAQSIKWGNIDFSSGIISYNRQKTGQKAIPPMTQDLKNLISRLSQGDDNDYICPVYAAMSKQSLRRSIHNVWIKCNIDLENKDGLIRFHSQRHTLVNNLLANGVSNVAAIADILGHKPTADFKMTLGYHNKSIQEVKDAMSHLTKVDDEKETVEISKGLKEKLDAVGMTVDNAIRLFLINLEH